jgi:hypothetical protein
MNVGDTVQVRINANYQGTERKEVDAKVVRVGETSAWVRIRDDVAEYLRTHRAVLTGYVSITELSTPLYRVIKRKLSRDFAGDGNPALGSEV